MARELVFTSEKKTVYRDGSTAIKEFCDGFPKAEVLNEALCNARVEDIEALNVPKILGVSVVDGKWSILKEYVEGKTLQQLMDENPDKLEEYMEGEEASLLAFTDGKTIVPMIASQDHKRVFDGDEGPNTGGMGTYAPAPVMTDVLRLKATELILKPVIAAMAAEGMPYQGCLYAGLMIKGDSVKVVEFNCRFGDPETQVVLPLLDGDLAEIMLACATGTLDQVDFGWYDKAAVCVVMASADVCLV